MPILSLPVVKNAEPVSQKPEGFVKKPSYGAQISKSEAHYCSPQRFRDAAQRGNWVF
jgi:hypothetical protein